MYFLLNQLSWLFIFLTNLSLLNNNKQTISAGHGRDPFAADDDMTVTTSIKSHAASLRFKDKNNKYKKIIDQAIIPTTKSYRSSSKHLV